VAGGDTKIIPGHGPLGTKAEFQKYRDMLATVRDKVAALKKAGASEQEAVAKKPTAEFDAAMGQGLHECRAVCRHCLSDAVGFYIAFSSQLSAFSLFGGW
jgi:hypothetical protein